MGHNRAKLDEQQVKQITTMFPFVTVTRIDIGLGWLDLVQGLCIKTKEFNDKYPDKAVVVVQIKERYGALRFFIRTHPGEGAQILDGFISIAVAKSTAMCEICAQVATLRAKGSYQKTLCDKHAEGLGYHEKVDPLEQYSTDEK